MTMTEIDLRNTRSEKLSVFQLQEDQYFVESSEGKICYKVSGNGTKSCSCADYTSKINKEPDFRCKHIMAVINGNGNIRKIDNGKHHAPRLDERFITKIKGKEFVLYSGLLDLAHQKGIRKMIVEPVQFPTKENKMEAICRATVESKDGELFVEIADANPLNVNRMVVEHILRVAATRAKARALRDYTDIGLTALEELGDLEEASEGNSGRINKNRKDFRTESTNSNPPKMEQSKGGVTADDRREEAKQKKTQEGKVPQAAGKAPDSGAQPAGTQDTQPADHQAAQNTAQPSAAQITAIEKLAERRGINGEQLVKIFTDKFKKPYGEINSDEAKNFIKHLQQAA